MNKASGGDGIPVEIFQILKDDAVEVLHSICQQIWKTQQWPQDRKRSVFIPIPKKGNAKERSNYCTIALISHSSLIAQLVKNPPAMQETWFDSWVRKIHWRRDRLPTSVFLGFPCGSTGKESACNIGDLGSIPGLGRYPGEGNGYPLQYSGLENSMDCTVHGVTKSLTRLSDFHFHFHTVAQ